jgi:hypothetical protein
MSEDSKLRKNLSIELDEEVSITTKKKYRSINMPQYVRYGVNEFEEDIVDILSKVSKPAHTMFVELKKTRDANSNLVTLVSPKSASKTNAQNSALKELSEVGLIARVGTKQLRTTDNEILQVPRRTFLINPQFLIPRSNDSFEVVYDYWLQLNGGKDYGSTSPHSR